MSKKLLKAEALLGVHSTARGFITERLLKIKKPRVSIVIHKDIKSAETTAEDILFFENVLADNVDRQNIYSVKIFPEYIEADPQIDSRAMDALCDRTDVLCELLNFLKDKKEKSKKSIDTSKLEKTLVLCTTLQALQGPCPSRESLHAATLSIQLNSHYSFQKLIHQLTDTLHYDSEAVCEKPGQYAVRGGIIDIYPINASAPYRLDFFGDEIDSIKKFDPTTQRTEGPDVLEITFSGMIEHTRRSKDSKTKNDFFDYIDSLPLENSINWIIHEPESYDTVDFFEKVKACSQRTEENWCVLTELDSYDVEGLEIVKKSRLNSEGLAAYQDPVLLSEKLGFERFQLEHEAHIHFAEKLLGWQKEGFGIWVATHNEAEKQRLGEFLKEHKQLSRLKPNYWIGNLTAGFKIEFEKLEVNLDISHLIAQRDIRTWLSLTKAAQGKSQGIVVTSDNEIFGRYRQRIPVLEKRKIPQKPQIDQLLNFSELVEGDYLVHLQHGICRYKDLRTLDLKGRKEEVISLEFDQGIQLHLPLHESHLVSRYVGLSKVEPKLGKIGSGNWEKTRRAAECASLDFAAQMLHVQAQRQTLPGFEFAPDSAMQKEFEGAFVYRETPDQLRTIVEVKKDMEKPTPMDRLLCGDVGFGKTEVAIRGAFKAVMNNKQVAVLVPTTVLCQQHFNTFRERMADYPIVVEMLSRFRQPHEQTKILDQLSNGKIDILVGTHRLLSQDVEYKNLGLLIIDEEHRFGVKQKEKIKHIKNNVDVLSMSATPIPRTLYMALTGARDLSVIETPPKSRLPIQTYVKYYSSEIVKEAIQHEINRGGQVFYLHNRVSTIESVTLRISEMMPDLRVGVGHGQMHEDELEQVMTRFVIGDYDVLVCTTIIESGLDIPNCNTIIIEGADMFGLSQLYQLRGRVGRFNRQAYCYLLLHSKKFIPSDVQKRLSTLKQYNQLGAGFKIAMRDLELRGAGNLLGGEQSGHIAGVGFDLYCQLLKQSIARLKGDKTASSIRAQMRLDFVIVGEEKMLPEIERIKEGFNPDFDIIKAGVANAKAECPKIEAYLSKDYILESQLRIDFYRKLAAAETYGAVQQITEDLKDRFGKLPFETQALIKMSEIRTLAESKNILEIVTVGDRLQCLRLENGKKIYIKHGNHFPRLTKLKPLLRLEEIKNFLKQQPS